MRNTQWNYERSMRKVSGVILCLLTVTGASLSARAQSVDLTSPKMRLSPEQLAIWSDASFQKRFTESYIAETEIEPRLTNEEREQMQKILALISSDKMDEAALLLEKSRNDASSAVFDFTLANIYFQQEMLDKAAGVYDAAVKKYPKFRRAWKNMALIYVRQNQFDKALPALTKVVELGGADSVTYGLMGFAYSSQENNLSAESAYRMAILLDPVTQDWKMGLLRSLFKQQRYAEAIALTTQLINTNPDRADLWLLQANAYIGLNQPLKAAQNYELVDRMGKSTPESLNMLADIYTNEELFELAANAYVKAMEKSPQVKPERAIRAAKVLTARGAFKETKALIKSIERLAGNQMSKDERKDLLKLRARLSVAEGSDSAEEIKLLEQIIDLDPLDGEALILLGQHSNRSGDPERAIFYYERAESLEKFEADAKVRHAQLLVNKGKYDEALPLLRRAQTIKPRDDIQKYIDQIERIAKTR